MGSVGPLPAHPARAEADRLANAAPASATFRSGALGAQARLLMLLGADAPLPVLLDALARYVETWAPSWHCSILLRDPRRNVLVSVAAPSLPLEYVERLGEIPIRDGACCCGTAAWRREAVTVHDIGLSPLWSGHRHLALPHGLRACWSVPFLDDAAEVLGTVALYDHRPRAPTDEERELLGFAAALAAMVVQQHRRLALLWANRERASLEHAVIESAELEREQLAIDLHDGVSQQLVGIEWLLASEAARSAGPQTEVLRRLRELVAGVQRDVRTLAAWMQPLSRRSGNLAEKLQEVVREAGAHHHVASRAEVRLRSDAPLDDLAQDQLLRILQGALSHALSRPDCAGVEVEMGDDAFELRLEVRVEGDGLGDGEPAALRAARYRALQFGAMLTFGRPTAGRSMMRLTIPLTMNTRTAPG
ncbi:MAG: GAF domain-containing protein [Gammaproteobacteria bacterium]|nr:GAF domain-containing protein [Gammaproteobacteria bacterium]